METFSGIAGELHRKSKYMVENEKQYIIRHNYHYRDCYYLQRKANERSYIRWSLATHTFHFFPIIMLVSLFPSFIRSDDSTILKPG